MRCPEFFIVGAPKCGTSSLHHHLRAHSSVFLGQRKDVPYFGSDLEHSIPGASRNREDYLAAFASAPANALIGDSCTLYMQSRRAAGEIAQWRPGARIVVMLRDPIELIISLHSHNIWMGEEDILELVPALAAEADRRAGRRIPSDNHFPAGLLYRDVAALGDQLERYMRAFSRDQVHVILFEELRADTAGTVERTLEFLGVEERVELDLSPVNVRREPRSLRLQSFLQQPPPGLERLFQAVTPRSLHGRVLPWVGRLNERPGAKPVLDSMIRAELAEELRPQVDKLERLLGQDLGEWCSSPRLTALSAA